MVALTLLFVANCKDCEPLEFPNTDAYADEPTNKLPPAELSTPNKTVFPELTKLPYAAAVVVPVMPNAGNVLAAVPIKFNLYEPGVPPIPTF